MQNPLLVRVVKGVVEPLALKELVAVFTQVQRPSPPVKGEKEKN